MGWWSDRTETQRFDLYTRGSLYALLIGTVPMSILFGVAESPANLPAAVVSVVLLAAATLVGCRVLGRGLDHAVHGTPVPWPWLRVYLVLVIACWAVSLVGYGSPGPGEPGTLGGVVAVLHLVAVLSPLLRWTWLTALVAGLAAVMAAAAYVLGSPVPSVFAVAWAVGLGGAGMIGAFRGSVWMLRIVWELDRARATSAELAVAEERLRFSRDLHDVMGRDLGVIALRSELAAGLARRGRPDEAAEEMLGVRSLAHEALREVREVVRGYRAVDLAVELDGARSVLTAAGATTTVTGDASALPIGAQSVLAWVVREGTTNVIRHAEATECALWVGVDEGEAVLTITNDGSLRRSGGVAGTGLAGLNERLRVVGGSLDVDDDRAAGRFRLTARVPLGAAVAENGSPVREESMR